MARQTSPRYQIQYVDPTLRNEPADVPAEIKRVVDAVERSAMFSQGAIADRPASTPGTPGITGRFFYATNENRLYYDYGTGWQPVDVGIVGDNVPIGSFFPYLGVAAPVGYLLCIGQSVARATYPALADIMGIPVPQANYNIPNMQRKIPVGRDPAYAPMDTIGETGGAETVALVAAEMPVHSHVVNNHAHGNWTVGANADVGIAPDGNHYHVPGSGVDFALNDGGVANTAGGSGRFSVTSRVGSTSWGGYHGHGVYQNPHGHQIPAEAPGTNNAGSGTAHSNMQPFIVSNYIVRAA